MKTEGRKGRSKLAICVEVKMSEISIALRNTTIVSVYVSMYVLVCVIAFVSPLNFEQLEYFS